MKLVEILFNFIFTYEPDETYTEINRLFYIHHLGLIKLAILSLNSRI